MKRLTPMAAAVLLAMSTQTFATGVTPYLPLNLDPQMERQVERVLILADKPVMSRPIAAATVLDALPKACAIDPVLCASVRRYLTRFMHKAGVAAASVEVAGSSGSGAQSIDPNRYGMAQDSHWNAAAQVYLQPSDYLLVDLGAVAYEGRTTYTGSLVSMGWQYFQLDLGYRPHWLSPMSDSSMLMSTEAPTMPSWTISNYVPFTPLGISYQIFEAEMSKSDHIEWQDGYTSGHPLLGGVQLTMEPASGWSLSLNRLAQFGGGARGNGTFGQLFKVLLNPSRYSNTTTDNLDQDFANQQASITSSFLFPGRVPFSVYIEYAGEDTSHGRNYLLGNSALSWGIRFPRLFRQFDLTLEASEWQNGWYTNTVYEDGMTNDGLVVGSWFADQRLFNDGVGGKSAMARLGWDPWFGGQMMLRLRLLDNQTYGQYPYQHYHDLTLEYSRPWNGMVLGASIDAGKDVFGGSFTRLAGFVRLGDAGSDSGAADSGQYQVTQDPGNQIFVDAGVHELKVKTDLTGTEPTTTGPTDSGAHFGLGARRAVSDHSDLGTRIEYDDVQGTSLLGVRLIDYRYRFSNPLALGVFLGAARYALATPAYGIYYGLGLQWRDVVPHVDVGLDLRYYDSVARDHVLPSDPQSSRPDSFYDISGGVLTVSYHF